MAKKERAKLLVDAEYLQALEDAFVRLDYLVDGGKSLRDALREAGKALTVVKALRRAGHNGIDSV
jgi:hypothetical protein